MRQKILVVDDDLDLTEVLAIVLGDNGFDVTAMHSGIQALAWLKSNKPDVILVDLMMPGMNGRDFLKELAKHKNLRAIPTIIMSASANLQAEFGAERILPKPFDIPYLCSQIRHLTSEKDQPRP